MTYVLEQPIKTHSKTYEKKVIRVDMTKEVALRMRRVMDAYAAEVGRLMFDAQTAQQLSHKLWVLHYKATYDEHRLRYLGRTFTTMTFICMTPSWIRFAKQAIQERMKEKGEDLNDLLEVLDRGREVKSC
jgi:hypothetical protein